MVADVGFIGFVCSPSEVHLIGLLRLVRIFMNCYNGLNYKLIKLLNYYYIDGDDLGRLESGGNNI